MMWYIQIHWYMMWYIQIHLLEQGAGRGRRTEKNWVKIRHPALRTHVLWSSAG